ncbi:hypothetical protein D3C85_1813810 [compost metagenome]
MNSLHKLVEGAAQFAEFVFAFHGQTSGQVAFALGDVLHRTTHGGQRAHQHVDQQGQQHRNDGDSDKHRDQR